MLLLFICTFAQFTELYSSEKNSLLIMAKKIQNWQHWVTSRFRIFTSFHQVTCHISLFLFVSAIKTCGKVTYAEKKAMCDKSVEWRMPLGFAIRTQLLRRGWWLYFPNISLLLRYWNDKLPIKHKLWRKYGTMFCNWTTFRVLLLQVKCYFVWSMIRNKKIIEIAMMII